MAFKLAWFALGVCSLISQVGCRSCITNMTFEIPSPDRRSRAVVYVRNCGATTWFTTEVSILYADEHVPLGHGNVTTLDDNNGNIPIADNHGAIAVRVRWLSASALEVGYPAAAVIYHRPARVRGVTIAYKPQG
jgi:hypothetical protein